MGAPAILSADVVMDESPSCSGCAQAGLATARGSGSMGCFVDERLAGGPRGETGGAIAVVDELHVGDRVVGAGGQRGAIAQVAGEGLKLVGAGRSAAEVFGAGSRRSGHDDPVVVVRLDEVQGGR